MSFGFQKNPDGTDAISVFPSITTVQVQFQLLNQGTGKACVGVSQNQANNCASDGNIDFDHSISISGLQPSVSYFAIVTAYDQSNNMIAQSDPIPFTQMAGDNFDQPQANPRHMPPGASAALSVFVMSNGAPVAGASVTFSVNPGDGFVGDPGTPGFNTTSYTTQTGANGSAQAGFQAGQNKGPVQVILTSPNVGHQGQIAVSIG